MEEGNVIVDVIFPTKNELLETMVTNYSRQKKFCDKLYADANENLTNSVVSEDSNSKRTKKENTALKEYNNQVRALGDTIAKMLQIQKNEAPRKEELDEDLRVIDEELV